MDTKNIAIKVIGIGKCGIDAVNYMIEHGVKAAEYVAIDTDAQALACCQAYDKVQISDWFLPNDSSTAALEKAAHEQESIKNMIGDSNIVFIVLAMGENTGWHLAPMIAKIVPPMEKLILAVALYHHDLPMEHSSTCLYLNHRSYWKARV